MAHSPIALHPSIRERLEPRMSATALVEYLILKADQQDTIVHNSRYVSGMVTAKYARARRALQAYNANPVRPKNDLEVVKKELRDRAKDPNIRPKAREEALRCAEAIDLFNGAENALGMRSLPLVEAPRFSEIEIEGVTLSIQPDFLIRPVPTNGKQRVGALMLRLQKTPDPNAVKMVTREQRGEHRREMARYMVAMIQMLLEQHPELGEFDRSLCFVADVRLPERIGAAPDHAARLRTIRAGCKQIAAMWDSIIPRPAIRKK